MFSSIDDCNYLDRYIRDLNSTRIFLRHSIACSPFIAQLSLQAFEAAEVAKKWEQTSWAKKLAARLKRASLTDFERFVVKVNKQKVSSMLIKSYVIVWGKDAMIWMSKRCIISTSIHSIIILCNSPKCSSLPYESFIDLP